MDDVEAPLARPTAASLLDGVLQLGREIHLEMDERTLAEKFHATLTALFPGRLIAIRLEAAAGRQVVATAGETVESAALVGPLVLKPRSLDKTKLDPAVVDAGRVEIAATTPPVFGRARAGFSIPLVAGGDIYGALDVGYLGVGAPSSTIADDDEGMLIPIANQLSVALRNFRLHAEARLLRDLLGGLIEHADALIVGVGRDWRVTVFNRALSQLTGRDPKEALGRDVRDLIPAGDRPRLVAFMGDFFAGRSHAPIQIDFPDRAGRQVRTVWNIAAVRAGSGRVDQLVAVGQDRTRLFSLERQIIQAEKLATLGELAAGVVHELGNPLTAITVYADYLVKKVATAPLDGSDAEKLRRILEGAERILKFSRSLVQYAAPTPVEAGPLALNDAVRQALFFCEHVLEGVRLDVELADGLPSFIGVRGQITQVVVNLVTNAVQALPAAGGKLRVATSRGADGTLALTVEDEGTGIAPEDRERIFEPFYTTKTDGKGSGLGLSVVRSIVERHGGKITVDSTVGRGTIFTVSFPARVLE